MGTERGRPRERAQLVVLLVGDVERGEHEPQVVEDAEPGSRLGRRHRHRGPPFGDGRRDAARTTTARSTFASRSRGR
jgi:hypothetical protein